MECFPVALDNQAGQVSGPWPFGTSQVIEQHLSKLVEGAGGRCAGIRVVTKLWPGDGHWFSLKAPNCITDWAGEYSGSWGEDGVFLSWSLVVHHPCTFSHHSWRFWQLVLSGSAWATPPWAPARLAFNCNPGVNTMSREWRLYDGTSLGGGCIIWENHGEITLIAYSIEVVNQNQQLCHCRFSWTQNFRKKWISLDHRVRKIDLSKSMGI